MKDCTDGGGKKLVSDGQGAMVCDSGFHEGVYAGPVRHGTIVVKPMRLETAGPRESGVIPLSGPFQLVGALKSWVPALPALVRGQWGRGVTRPAWYAEMAASTRLRTPNFVSTALT